MYTYIIFNVHNMDFIGNECVWLNIQNKYLQGLVKNFGCQGSYNQVKVPLLFLMY